MANSMGWKGLASGERTECIVVLLLWLLCVVWLSWDWDVCSLDFVLLGWEQTDVKVRIRDTVLIFDMVQYLSSVTYFGYPV